MHNFANVTSLSLSNVCVVQIWRSWKISLCNWTVYHRQCDGGGMSELTVPVAHGCLVWLCLSRNTHHLKTGCTRRPAGSFWNQRWWTVPIWNSSGMSQMRRDSSSLCVMKNSSGKEAWLKLFSSDVCSLCILIDGCFIYTFIFASRHPVTSMTLHAQCTHLHIRTTKIQRIQLCTAYSNRSFECVGKEKDATRMKIAVRFLLPSF